MKLWKATGRVFLLVFSVLYLASYSQVAFASPRIVSPTEAQVVTDVNEVYTFQTDNGIDQWTIWNPDGTYLCGDSVSGYGSGVSWSMAGQASACGSTLSGTDGPYHYLIVTSRTADCAYTSNYADCKASIYYEGEDVCVDVGDTGFCTTPPPEPPAPEPPDATSTLILKAVNTTNYLLLLFLTMAWFLLLWVGYSKMNKTSS